MANEIILLNISGQDKPGLTSSLTSVLAQYGAKVLDIGQANIHDTLSLGILFEIQSGANSAAVLKDLLFKSYELGIKAKFTPITLENYEKWVSLQGKDRYIITILGEKLSAEQISKVTHVISEKNLNIDAITRLTGRTSLVKKDEYPRASIQLSIRGKIDNKAEFTEKFMKISHDLDVDIAFQEDNIYRRNRRLVCFDMDSTLIQTEVIDELAELAGVGDEVRAITEAAMQGEIDFKESFISRMKLLKGLKEEVLHEVAINLPITKGAIRLIETLKNYGFKTAILSGGFTYFGHYLQKELGIDYVYANQLEIKDGALTGGYLGEIVDGNKKAEFLKEIAEKEGINISQTIAVGDGANDLPMLNLAGLGIAFHAKPTVKDNAQSSISSIGLDGVLYLLGYHDRHIDLLE
ncbi:MAG: phosphoserine phosphatase SerB [Flavobacteriales bacterium]|nr:phosphoserine phosphatase SerB [Flavobacteriia bacterium]NCP05743.1 phosphoserine phosphatase SerB [Flavobacteriales bacterium]PIV94527.1 MAG: phosphoserine phosphatase SerB [Flavobacteriaceae bacterium CG17_big_fil_post_rev_8_21_14_2_50_33_15]PIY10670.1 MAG: phosphoserine phosphatase SerB [Flavobacteriaceae bacterium CG_4_10_14_3_um_filter_33_47]PJB18134.1 MAG: phosphoserine phosphatase SerB [Flavobacteriaceae bacterium CG_4_9_14_3_um_filter_33_16]